MRVLVVGGTGFLGGATARAGIASGHEVTVMTRSGQNVPHGATPLVADRTQGLPDLRGRFDAVIDTCGYAPDMITDLARAVGPVHYVFVSSISVYDDMSEPGLDETASAPCASAAQLDMAAQIPADQRGKADPYGAAYGPLKRSCEIAAQKSFGGQATLIRLGLIVGPEDYTDRFTWWVRRCDAGGDIAVPGPPDRNVQIIDVRDAAAFLVHVAQNRIAGILNVTGTPMTIDDMLTGIQSRTGVPLRPIYAPLSAFTDAGLRHWTDLPLILPDTPDLAHMLNVSTARAKAVGLTECPFPDTVQAVLDWDRTQRHRALKSGMSTEAETRILDRARRPRT